MPELMVCHYRQSNNYQRVMLARSSRETALLVLGFTLDDRRSALAALDIADLTFTAEASGYPARR